MIKDILVNLSYGTSRDGVSNYALSVAETFGAHIVGTAFAYYPVMASGVGLSANFIRVQQAEAQERAESVAAAFDEATRRAPAFQPTRAVLKLALATYQPSLRISQDDSIFPLLVYWQG